MTVDNCGSSNNNNKKATKNRIFIFNLHFLYSLAQAAHHEEDDNRDTAEKRASERNKWQL